MLAAVGPSSFRIALPESLRRLHPVFHSSLLRKLEGPLPPIHEPIFEDNNFEDLFEVDYIVDARKRRNRLEYLVHWKHYGIFDRTWEPAKNLENASEALEKFYKSRGRDLHYSPINESHAHGT